MKKSILLSLLILLSISLMSQEKGSYISIWGGAGPTGFKYKMNGINFATPKNDILLGGQAGLQFSYYFTKHVGLSLGAGVSHYRTKALLSGDFREDKWFDLGNYVDNDFALHPKDYQLRVRTQNWEEYQSGKFIEVPLLINFQKKFGEKEYFGLYLSLGAKFQYAFSAKYAIVDGDNEDQHKLMISGYYPEDNMELGGFGGKPMPYHAFSSIYNPGEVLSDGTGKYKFKFNIAAVGEAGILISLSRRVDIALGAFIDYGLMDINRKPDDKTKKTLFTGPAPENDYVTNAEDHPGNGISYNSIINSTYGADNQNRYVDKVSTLSYGGKIGLRIKLGKLSQKQEPQVSFAPCDKDTVYIYKFEPQPLDSILKEIMDALKDMPRQEPPAPPVEEEGEFPSYIPAEDIDFLFGPIYFDLDKAILRPESIIDLDKKVEILNKYPELRLVIFGNTCDLGNDPHNYKLGERRAEAAKNYLISKGIARERLESSTLSRFQPELPNTNEPNRTHNRRDDFKPVYQKK